MIVEMDREEFLTLAYHLNIMNKIVKKALKKTYGKAYKNYYATFNSAVETVKDNFDTDKENFAIDFPKEEIYMIHSFLDSYIKRLREDEIGEKEETHLKLLNKIKNKFAEKHK